MLKHPRALDAFLRANQMNMYTRDKIVNFATFVRRYLSLKQCHCGGVEQGMLDGSYRLHSFAFYSQLSIKLAIFGRQKQASCGWRLIYANDYRRYNLAGKSNSMFSSKVNRFDGFVNR